MASYRRRRTRRPRRYRRRMRGLGSIITARRLRGLGGVRLGRVGSPGSFLGALIPVGVGGGVAALTTIGIRHFAKPAQSQGQLALYKYAPWIGVGAGLLASGGLYVAAGGPAALTGALSAGLAGGAMVLNDVVGASKLGEHAMALATDSGGASNGGNGGTGAIVVERGGMGALVLEPSTSRGYGMQGVGSYGEVVNLGNVTPAAFGTPGFNI
ncbi:MAG: hypothetical protein JSV86_05435 [Gemmatimonadota bacterium]|nr:MAG: hypothetical protein JSV86_05435 [Gemmatimonadota bacterium]